ncbi:hypothetical protein VTK26DRAFT_8115 [Humicola hyalothermophila]
MKRRPARHNLDLLATEAAATYNSPNCITPAAICWCMWLDVLVFGAISARLERSPDPLSTAIVHAAFCERLNNTRRAPVRVRFRLKRSRAAITHPTRRPERWDWVPLVDGGMPSGPSQHAGVPEPRCQPKVACHQECFATLRLCPLSPRWDLRSQTSVPSVALVLSGKLVQVLKRKGPAECDVSPRQHLHTRSSLAERGDALV